MKKAILAVLICAFAVSPALANEFAADQAAALKAVHTQMEKFKDDADAMKVLDEQKGCIEKATDLQGLHDCLEPVTAEKKEAAPVKE